MVFVYYSGSGFLINYPSLDFAAKEIAQGTYQGIFALSDADEKELFYTEKVSIRYLELTNHEDSPEFKSKLNKLNDEGFITDSIKELHISFDIFLFETQEKQESLEKNKERPIFLMTTAFNGLCTINITANEKHYKTTDGNKLSILDSSEIEEQIATNTDKSKLDKPLHTRERRTMLTIIAALCTQNGIDPTARGAAQRVREITEINGTPIDDETIKKYLSKISEI